MGAVADELLVERLLRVIDEGRRTATYKMALLLALIDAVALLPGESEIPTRLLADLVFDSYFPQTRRYIEASGSSRLACQISMKNLVVVRSVEEVRAVAASGGLHTLAEVRRALPALVEAAIDKVEDSFVADPIPRLQVVGRHLSPFLYEVDWEPGSSICGLRARGHDRVRLLDGVAQRLVVIGPMLRPLIELHWTRDVAKWTGIACEDEGLRQHLFGASRASFPGRLVERLGELQDGRCFYCGSTLGRQREVDHFIAWSRWRNDAIENLVLADKCNGAKSDYLAAGVHLGRWRLRLEKKGEALAEVASESGWISAAHRSWVLARSTYGFLAPGTPLWLHGRTFESAAGPLL